MTNRTVTIRDRQYTVEPPSEIVLMPFLKILQAVDEADADAMQATIMTWFGDRENHIDISYIVTQAVPEIDPKLCSFENRRYPDGSSVTRHILRLNVTEIMAVIMNCIPEDEAKIQEMRQRLEAEQAKQSTAITVPNPEPTGYGLIADNSLLVR